LPVATTVGDRVVVEAAVTLMSTSWAVAMVIVGTDDLLP
jgi:hypothetical protein